MEHLQDRPDDWETATDMEHLEALADHQPVVQPFWMAYLRNHRPHVLRRRLLLFQEMGGYLGRPARCWLGRRR